jgi:hypothetical protein
MIKKGKPTNTVVRMFMDKRSKKSHRSLLRWNNLDTISRRVSADNIQHTRVNLLKVTDNDKKLSITSYFLAPRVTFNSEFIQSKIMWNICYIRETKRLYVDGLKELRLYLNGDKDVRDILTKLGVEAFAVDKLIQEVKHQENGLSLGHLMNRVTLKAIVTGNCTNANDLVVRYFKSVGIKDMNYKRLRTYYNHHDNYDLAYLPLRVCANMDNLFTYFSKNFRYKTTILNDSIDMALQLKRTINFKWTERRLTEEHDDMVKIIAKIKIESADPTPVNYFELNVPKVEGVTLLTSSRDLVEESQTLLHCVGTSDNYMNKMREYKALILRYARPDFRGTVEVDISGAAHGWGASKEKSRIRISQFSGYKNKSPEQTTREKVLELLANEFNPFITELQDTVGYEFKDGVRVVNPALPIPYEYDLPF